MRKIDCQGCEYFTRKKCTVYISDPMFGEKPFVRQMYARNYCTKQEKDCTDIKECKYISEMKKFEKVIKIIKSCNWIPDYCGKEDLDINLLSISTRYYPDHTAHASFIICTPDEDVYYEILNSPEIKGNSEEDCKSKAKQWYIDNLEQALNNLINNKIKPF